MGYRGRGNIPKTTASMYGLTYNTKREYRFINEVVRSLSVGGTYGARSTVKLRINAMAKEALVSFIRDLAHRIIDQSRDRSGKATLQARDIETAVSIELGGGELMIHSIVLGRSAVTNANPSKANGENKPPANKLMVAPSYVRKQLKIAGFGRVAKMASLYLAAVLEYLIVEVVELSGENAKSCGKTVRIASPPFSIDRLDNHSPSPLLLVSL
ncbi:hypothetical protein SAMD00019534_079120 [Acytostelium subglobosum LB1]|uniref:hypothetical protein n=1 Tax=Acytostelium subglobosum LB1 TaxID=1410327 RepID=UPI0006450C0C|nr:hypothetical protein SAMD00019534_079120 [Acytostelium subglobosum LB1]GAM24737.1 hypothetical protein SAMD00019534_079120 [Acytostelium subglobosum LB1]|eukprot:XP_012752406.1 hypothetical protein SAMD00019534_079120 [Acytostelium subglobosum LB1]